MKRVHNFLKIVLLMLMLFSIKTQSW